MERNDPSLRRLGLRLTALREQRKFTVDDLAARSGIQAWQLVRIESGQVNVLFTTVLALARGLGITPHELLESL